MATVESVKVEMGDISLDLDKHGKWKPPHAQIFKKDPSAIIPARSTEEAAGYDLCTLEDFSISPGQLVAVRTGLVIRPPFGMHIEILSRSGLAFKYGVRVANPIGLIDRDYSGPEDEIKVLLFRDEVSTYSSAGACITKPMPDPLIFPKGSRIAQLVFRDTILLDFEEVNEAPKNLSRDGFGSTGV